MAGRAFKVPIPISYNNVTEAKLVQKGSEVWVQLPANQVQDRRMCRKSVYMQDFNGNKRSIPRRHRNVKAKVDTRRANNPHPGEDFLGFRGNTTKYKTEDSMDRAADFDSNQINSGRNRMYRSFSSSFDGIGSGSNYSRMKSKPSGPIAALLPVMDNAKSSEFRMDHHYASPSRMSLERSYNDKARDALPGLSKWLNSGDMHDVTVANHSQTIDGDNFLENPLRRPDLINYDLKRSVTIRTPPRLSAGSRHGSRSALGRRLHEGPAILDNADHTVTLDPPTFENSAKRHELEILTRVNPSHTSSLGSNALDHLYQPSGSGSRHGYTVVGESYEHGNAMYSNTNSANRGSFNIAPDWVSERKKSVVIRH